LGLLLDARKFSLILRRRFASRLAEVVLIAFVAAVEFLTTDVLRRCVRLLFTRPKGSITLNVKDVQLVLHMYFGEWGRSVLLQHRVKMVDLLAARDVGYVKLSRA
jgi:histone H3/H4